MLQNVQMALEYLRFKKVNLLYNSIYFYIVFFYFYCRLFLDQTRKYPGRRYCRWKSKAYSGSNMDNHTSLPGWYRIFLLVDISICVRKVLHKNKLLHNACHVSKNKTRDAPENHFNNGLQVPCC